MFLPDVCEIKIFLFCFGLKLVHLATLQHFDAPELGDTMIFVSATVHCFSQISTYLKLLFA